MDLTSLSTSQVHELLKQYTCSANHVRSFITPMSLRCAAQLGIPDAIHAHGKPMTLEELATSIGIQPQKTQFLLQLMRFLTHTGYFSYQKIGGSDAKGYGLTLGSQLLLQDHPCSVKPSLLMALSPMSINSWLNLSKWFQSDNDDVPFNASNGTSLYGDASHKVEFNKNLNKLMACDSWLVSTVLIKNQHSIFEGLISLVDVGGGVGGMAKAIANAYPHIHCTVLDLPHVIEGLEGTHNLKYVAGDMLKEVPQANAVLLKWILHNWKDEDCVKILKQCRRAIQGNGSRGGKLIIIDTVMDDDDHQSGIEDYYKTRETQLFCDMQMMNMLTGKERTKKEWEKLFDDSGFGGGYKVFPVLGWRSLIEVYP